VKLTKAASGVADGLASTARVITAADLIMVTVFGSFILGDRNWWFPAWLDRLIPRLHVEAGPDLQPVPATVVGGSHEASYAEPDDSNRLVPMSRSASTPK